MMLFLQKNKQKIFSFIIALYCLPLHFSRPIPYSFDGGWMTSLNLAIKNHLIFGKEFIFTYGPLGTLSTRCNLYTGNLLLFAADLFLLVGCYHFIHKYVIPHKGWFFIALLTMLIFRSAIFSQSLFIIFIIYASVNLLGNFRSYFEAGYYGMACVLLFFIKINYGILTLAGFTILALLMLLRNHRMLFFFIPITVALFTITCFTVHIDLVHYIKHSIVVSRQYDEVGYWPIKFTHLAFCSALLLLATMAGILLYYLWRSRKQGTLTLNSVMFTCCIAASCFIIYKNAFTRADLHHYSEFFAVFPFFLSAVLFLCRLHTHMLAKIIVVICITISGYNLMRPDIEDKAIRTGYYLSYLSPLDYFKGLFQKRQKEMPPIRLLSPDVVKNIGNTTIDIIPWETGLLHFYNFNYCPRPVPQTCGYAGPLDSINAAFFHGPTRPGIVMINSFPIDYKYFFWEESLSKTALRLNYDFDGIAGVNSPDSLSTDDFASYLLLRSKKNVNQSPVFDKLDTRQVKLDDTVQLNFPAGDAIYMTASFRYTLRGSMRRLLFQPPYMNVTLYLDDGSARIFRAPLPSLQVPVLVNKAILTNTDLRNYFTGDLKNCKNITAIAFHPVTYGFESLYSIQFMKLRNY